MVRYCTYEQVSGDEDATGAGPELLHDQISVLLLHVAMLKGKKVSYSYKSLTTISKIVSWNKH